MSDHRWQGYSHEELYRQLHNGPGPAASAASIRRWSDMSAALADIDADIKQALGNSRAGWTGKAADAADAALHPLARWARDAQAGAELMRLSAELQAEYIGKARADMPAPKEVTAEKPNPLVTGVVHLFGGQTDYEVQEAAKAAAEQRAFEVMEVYQTSTAANTATLGQFTKPPELQLDTGHGSPTGGSSGGAGPVAPVRPGVVPPARRAPGSGPTAAPTGGRSSSAPVPAPPRPGGVGSGGPVTRISAATPVVAPPAPPTSTPASPGATGTTPAAAPARGVPQPRLDGTASSAARPGPQHRPGWNAAEATHLAEARRANQPTGVLGLDLAAGAPATPAPVAPAMRARGEEDREHQSFLVEDEDVFGDGRQYAPPVIGE